MNNYLKPWLRAIFITESHEPFVDRDAWTGDVIQLMIIVITAASMALLISNMAGIFTFLETLPIYILFVVVSTSWLLHRRFHWRGLKFFPPFLLFALSLYGTILTGASTNLILFFLLTALMANMLLGPQARRPTILICVISYGAAVQWFHPLPWLNLLPSVIMLFFSLVGVSVLQWYYEFKLKELLRVEMAANARLRGEIERRTRAENRQHEQESQLQRLANYTTDLVAELDPAGIFRYISPSYKRLLGYEPADLVGTNAFNIVHPGDLEAARQAIQDLRAYHEPLRVQVRTLHADGHYVTFEISGVAVMDDDQELSGFVLSSRDITAQKIAEAANQESERKFRNIVEALPLGMHMYTLHENGELIFTGYNQAANRLLEVDHASFLNETIEEAFPGLAGTDVPAAYKKVAREGNTWEQEQINYKNGEIEGCFEVYAFQVANNRIAAIFNDITARIKVAEALRLSEEKFSTAFLISPDAVNINRFEDGKYIEVNESFLKIIGYSREELLGSSSVELNIWANLADRRRMIKELLKNGEMENMVAHFLRKDGCVIVGSMSAKIIELKGERCILSITRDITEKVKADAELLVAHEKLEQAYQATLEGWAQALELRERETANHSRRVVELTLRMARALGIENDRLVQIQRGALLHDIGKLGVPDHILLKPDKLTADEWTIMRMHPMYAYKLLNEIDYLHTSIDIPYCHHEHWDGSGYPRGLKGEDIPLAARIFSIIDVYDALLSNRPYRPAWTEPEVKAYLLAQKGKMFDPALVDLFFEVVKDEKWPALGEAIGE